MADTDKNNQGFASENYSDNKAEQARRMGGKDSGSNGAAGKTEAAKKGGENSRDSSS